MESGIPDGNRQKATRKERMGQLKEKLKKLQAMESSAHRKARNGQLVALGIAVEELLKCGDDDFRKALIDKLQCSVKERNLDRVNAAIARIAT